MPFLEVKNLHARVTGTDAGILNGLDINVNAGEVHAIMGPNGSGKSTFANVLAGSPHYEVTAGQVLLGGEDLLPLMPEQRSWRGVFLAFQYPAEIPGVRLWQFLKAAHDAVNVHRGLPKLGVREFNKVFDAAVKDVAINPDLTRRSLNEGFSGGEKKRNELLQLKVLQPELCVMDETDSGLDVDALRTVGEVVTSMRTKDRSFIIVTHYSRILQHIEPDYVHVLVGGRIVESGSAALAHNIEKTGYERWVKAAASA